MQSRRDFVKMVALAGMACLVPGCGGGGGGGAVGSSAPSALQALDPQAPVSSGFPQSPLLRKFVSPLPGLGGSGLPIATADRTSLPGRDLYQLAAVQFKQQMHPDLPATTLWGYVDLVTGRAAYLGPLIVAQRGTPVIVHMRNNLPSTHPLPIDMSLMGGDMGIPANRITVHLHGGVVPWTMDGGPFSWYSPSGTGPGAGAGPSFMNALAGSPGVAQYYYPNQQSSRLMWYHDHAADITRLNVYAGLVAGYLLMDGPTFSDPDSLVNRGVVPGLASTIPLIIQDKTFNADGSLGYASQYLVNPGTPPGFGRWDVGAPANGFSNQGSPPLPSCVPEFFADTPVINGMAYPVLEVEPRRYRFLLLNGSQARFYNLNLFVEDTNANPGEPAFSDPGGGAGPAFLQIGNECGVLPAPVAWPPSATPGTAPAPTGAQLMPRFSDGSVDPNGPHSLVLAPAERADLIIDFSAFAGKSLILYNDAPAPFPSGDDRNDYFTGNPDQTAAGGTPSTQPGHGPNIRTLMLIRVAATGTPDPFGDFAATWNALATVAQGGQQGLLGSAYTASHPGEPDLNPAGVPIHNKTLNEDFDEFGRLIQRLGTDVKAPGITDSFGRNYMDAPTEVYHNNDTVIWDVYNTTGDTHPMHFHLANAQVLGHAPFTTVGTPPAALNPPDDNYRGWKETVRMNPGEMTRVIMKFALPDPATLPFVVPPSTRDPNFPPDANEYVWHCHILEHEEHDMMRPLIITS